MQILFVQLEITKFSKFVLCSQTNAALILLKLEYSVGILDFRSLKFKKGARSPGSCERPQGYEYKLMALHKYNGSPSMIMLRYCCEGPHLLPPSGRSRGTLKNKTDQESHSGFAYTESIRCSGKNQF